MRNPSQASVHFHIIYNLLIVSNLRNKVSCYNLQFQPGIVTMISDSVRIGDHICLYCEDSAGYIFSEGSRYGCNLSAAYKSCVQLTILWQPVKFCCLSHGNLFRFAFLSNRCEFNLIIIIYIYILARRIMEYLWNVSSCERNQSIYRIPTVSIHCILWFLPNIKRKNEVNKILGVCVKTKLYIKVFTCIIWYMYLLV